MFLDAHRRLEIRLTTAKILIVWRWNRDIDEYAALVPPSRVAVVSRSRRNLRRLEIPEQKFGPIFGWNPVRGLLVRLRGVKEHTHEEWETVRTARKGVIYQSVLASSSLCVNRHGIFSNLGFRAAI